MTKRSRWSSTSRISTRSTLKAATYLRAWPREAAGPPRGRYRSPSPRLQVALVGGFPLLARRRARETRGRPLLAGPPGPRRALWDAGALGTRRLGAGGAAVAGDRHRREHG